METEIRTSTEPNPQLAALRCWVGLFYVYACLNNALTTRHSNCMNKNPTRAVYQRGDRY